MLPQPVERDARLSRHMVLLILGLALLARLGMLFAGDFITRPDEVFQQLEPAHRLVTGYGVVTWEWVEGIRSWLVPGFIALIMRGAASLGLGHSVTVVRCVFAVLSLGVVALAMRWGQMTGGRRAALFCGIATALWPDLALFGSRTLSEVEGGNLLAAAVMLARLGYAAKERGWRSGSTLAAGLCLGLSLAIRLQLAPGVMVVGLWCLWRDWRRLGVPVAIAFVVVMLGQGALDAATWGSPWQSIWKNFVVNFNEGRADTYGVMLPTYYLTAFASFWGALCVPIVLLVWIGMRGAALELLTALAILGAHTVIRHKEYTFVYAAIPLIALLSARGLALWSARLGTSPRQDSGIAVASAACLLLAYLSGYNAYRHRDSSYARLMHVVHREAGVCGVGVYGTSFPVWGVSGGYAYLDRRVPLFYAASPDALQADLTHINALIAEHAALPTPPPGFTLDRCDKQSCLLRRDGPCAPVADTAHRAFGLDGY